MEEQRIKSLIIQYEDSIRYQKKLLDFYFAETLLSVIPICMENQETLETRLEEKTEECKRLKSTLESAHYRVAKFYTTKYSENTAVKEYLDFAVFLSTFRNSNDDISSASNLEVKFFQYFDISLDIDYNEESNKDEQESIGGRLQSDEITNEGKCPVMPLNVINEDMLSLNSKLELAQESLNAEKLQSNQLKCERDSLDYLSDKLCYLLFEYQKRISIPAGKKEKSCQTSEDSAACDSSLFTQKNTLQPDIQFPFGWKSELELALLSLNAEKLQSNQLKCERDSLDYLSDKLCYLLFQYQKRISIPAGKKEKSCQTSEDSAACDSSLFTQKNTLQPDIQFPFGWKSELELALLSLNAEKLQSNQLKRERDSLDYLSDKLCYLLFQYQKRISIPAGKKEKSSQTSHDSATCNSSLFTQTNTLQPDVEIPFDELMLALSQNSQENNSPVKDINAASILSKTSEPIPDSENVSLDQIIADSSDVLFQDQLPELLNENQIFSDVVFVFQDHLLELPSDISREALVTEEYVPESELDNVTENEPKKEQEKIHKKRRRAADINIEKSITSNNALPRSTIVPHAAHSPPYHCEKCDKSYPGEKDGQKLVKCPVCDALEHHTSHEVPGQHCNICNRSFAWRSLLERHIKSVHSKVKPFKCSQCDKCFARKGELKNHAFVHQTQKSFECSICKQRFKHLSNKKRHEQIFHKKIGLFQCAHCDKQFGYRSGLIHHIRRMHFSDISRNFKCTLCDRAFFVKSALKSHQSVHSSDKPVKCSICDKKFKTNNDKKRHEWSAHVKGDRFHCAHCDNVYSVKHNLLSHLRNYHADLFGP